MIATAILYTLHMWEAASECKLKRERDKWLEIFVIFKIKSRWEGEEKL